MKYFEKYTSNTTAGSTTQYFFESDGEIQVGRVYYKIFCTGQFEYSLLYSNTVDSTFSDGKVSTCNKVCDQWEIVSLKVGKCKNCGMDDPCEPQSFANVTFDGKPGKVVNPGELFNTDPFVFEAEKGEFMCIEMEFRGEMIPNHQEFQMAAFRKTDGEWKSSVQLPVPSMVGCDRKVKARIAFLGDSITQGIGATKNSYRHWNSVVAEALGEKYAFWNLGIGFARCADAASDGMWLYKARQNDIVVVCLGVNDILRNVSSVPENLAEIIAKLKESGIKVVIQSIPPFDFSGEKREKWHEYNAVIRDELSNTADGYFYNVDLLVNAEENDRHAIYGGHPNDDGCKIWGSALAHYMKAFLEKENL